MMRRFNSTLILILILILAAAAAGTACSHANTGSNNASQAAVTASGGAAGSVPGARPGGRVGSHGMVVFGGQNATYLSHIPMFHTPHDVQLLLEVAFDAGDPNVALPSSYSSELYTIVPETMSLDDVRLGIRTSFTVTLYQGNFEQGGQAIAQNVSVSVKRRIFDRTLDFNAVDPPQPDYILLGTGSDTTLVRVIHSQTTSIDEISPFVVASNSTITPAQLAEGATIQLNAGPQAADGTIGLTGASSGETAYGTKKAPLSCLTPPMYEDVCTAQ